MLKIFAKNKSLKQRLLLAAGVAAIVQPAVVLAADIDTVVVTAQKRDQNSQDVPISLTALSGDALEELGIQSSDQLITQTPNLHGIFDPGFATFNIRGQQLLDFGDGNESPVGLYIDQVYVASPAAQAAQIFDLERIEVLRGPQGTLFGRNSAAGLIHFISKKPTDTLDGALSLQYGSNNQVIVNAALGGPLSDRVRVRAATKYNRDDGWQESAFTGQGLSASDVWAGRLLVEMDATDEFTVLLNVHGSRDRSTPIGWSGYGVIDPATSLPCSRDQALNNECLAGLNALFFIPTFGFSFAPGIDRDTIYNTTIQSINTDSIGASATLSWDLDEQLQLVSITAFDHIDKFAEYEFDGLPEPGFVESFTLDAKQWSQEIRLHGAHGPANWVAGGFYFRDMREIGFSLPEFELNATSFFGLFLPPIDDIESEVAALFGTPNIVDLKTEAWAIFAQLDYDLTDNLTVTGGIRYSDETKDYAVTDDRDDPFVGDPGGAIFSTLGFPPIPISPFPQTESVSEDQITWRAGLSWRPQVDVQLFATVATGFKSPDYNFAVITPDNTAPVASETSTSYEVGIKSEFFDRRLRLNATAFYKEVEDMQANRFINGAQRFVNVGNAEILGAEIEIQAAPTDLFFASLGVGIADSEIKAPGTEFDGNEFPNTPKFNLNGVVQQKLPEMGSLGQFSVQADFRWQSRQEFSPLVSVLDFEDSYGVVNFRILWDAPGGGWGGQVFLENAFDKEFATNNATFPTFATRSWGRPRLWGVRITKDIN